MKGGFGERRNPEDGFSVGIWHGVTRGHLGHFCPVLFLSVEQSDAFELNGSCRVSGEGSVPSFSLLFSLLFFPPFFLCFI